jgi:hypothetical protein
MTMMTNEPILSHDEISELLNAVKADREARHVFLAMSREDQLLAILGMIAFTNSQVANLQKEILTYRREREIREKRVGDLAITTGSKIAAGIRKELEGRFGFWGDIGKSVLQSVVTVIALALLYLAFGGKLP